jgi:hypothetical protein
MKPGEAFERQIEKYFKDAFPDASVEFSKKVKDVHTGRKRQADVWVEATQLGGSKVKVLVSCKDHKRPLGVGAVETFVGEVESLGADAGVLWSRSGFRKPAVEKAKAKNIACCRIFDNAVLEKPNTIFALVYAAVPVFWVSLMPLQPMRGKRQYLWKEILSLQGDVSGMRGNISEILSFLQMKLYTAATDQDPLVPGKTAHRKLSWTFDVTAPRVPSGNLTIAIDWLWFIGESNVLTAQGATIETERAFKGKVTLPGVPVDGTMVDGNWRLVDEPADSAPDDPVRFTLTPVSWGTPSSMLAVMGESPAYGVVTQALSPIADSTGFGGKRTPTNAIRMNHTIELIPAIDVRGQKATPPSKPEETRPSE